MIDRQGAVLGLVSLLPVPYPDLLGWSGERVVRLIPTTLWGAQEAGLGRSSTWYVTAEAFPLQQKLPQDKATNRSPSSR